MEKSDKQRKPITIKNLAELKRFIQPGVEFKTLSQKNHPDLVGLTRVVTTVQTVCFYSKIKDQPNSRFSTDNGGKGFRTDFAKADAYIFDGTTVKVKDTRNKDRGVIYEFEFYNRVERLAVETIQEKRRIYKGVSANIDFYSGLMYRILGLPDQLFTPMFAVARMVGWSAHRLEELMNCDKIIRPAYQSIAMDKEYVPMKDRIVIAK